jgi:hypothetical protein
MMEGVDMRRELGRGNLDRLISVYATEGKPPLVPPSSILVRRENVMEPDNTVRSPSGGDYTTKQFLGQI